MNPPSPASVATLGELTLNEPAVVLDVSAPSHAPEWSRQLAELGFLPGEPVCVLARGLPGGDPLVVRIADSTYALRQAEADCVRVQRRAEAAA